MCYWLTGLFWCVSELSFLQKRVHKISHLIIIHKPLIRRWRSPNHWSTRHMFHPCMRVHPMLLKRHRWQTSTVTPPTRGARVRCRTSTSCETRSCSKTSRIWNSWRSGHGGLRNPSCLSLRRNLSSLAKYHHCPGKWSRPCHWFMLVVHDQNKMFIRNISFMLN